MNRRFITYILLITASVFWGVSFIMTKELFLTEPHMTVTILITLRLAIASIFMAPTLLLHHIKRKDLKWFLLLALCEPFVYSLCETSGVQLVSGSLASVVVATIPLFVPFGMAFVYKERIKLPLIIGIAMSLVGISMMLIGHGTVSGNLLGLAFLAGAVFIAVVYTLLLVKIVDSYSPFVITAYQNLFGFVYFVPLMLLTDGAHLPLLSWSPKMLALLAILGIFCSTLAYVFYNKGVRDLGASAACIFNNTIPIFSLIAALILGQEHFSWNAVLGMAIVIAGVVLAQRTIESKK